MEREVTLITGASSGIGLEFARQLAQKEHILILVARNKKRLELLSKELSTKAYILPLDLTDSSASDKVKHFLEKKKLKVTNLVNNAGFGSFGEFQKLDHQKEITMIDLNCRAVVDLTHVLLPQIIKQKGRILNVASVAAFQPMPSMTTYAATKSLVYSFSLALNEEIKTKGASCTVLCPGPTESNFAKLANMQKFFDRGSLMTAQRVASLGIDAMFKRKIIAVTGRRNQFGVLITKILPSTLAAKIMLRILR